MEPEEYSLEDFSKDNAEERRRKEFRDFLVVREIAGSITGTPHSSRIPSELLLDAGGSIEISQPINEEMDTHNSTILVHRSDENEIEGVEIICTCGKKTFVKFDYK